MCGICGFVGFQDDVLLRRMMAKLWNRGPDSEGTYFSPNASLGHRRLSIIDLISGDQPIYNEDQTLCIVFNGEIYNFREIRMMLEKQGHVFYTQTDTEVILHAYEELGENCVNIFNGEFSIAIWDKKESTLFLARDRLGIRPLYYCLSGDKIAFSSEIKPLLLWKEISREINLLALDCYLTLRYVPADMTLIEGVVKLPPAHCLTFRNGQMLTRKYWSAEPQPAPTIKPRDVEEEFFELLKESVRLRLISDVPLGAYLSGGLDSSTLVGLMTMFSDAPVKTFTIGGFGGIADETQKARVVANYFQTEHHELTIERQDLELLPRIVSHMDSPTGDAIIIPTYLLAKETAKHVKVVISGEGADEILGGYVHHMLMGYSDIYQRLTPYFLQQLTAGIVGLLPSAFLNRWFPYPSKLGEKGKERLCQYLYMLAKGSSVGLEFLTLVGLFHDRQEIYTDQVNNSLFDKDFLVRRMDAGIIHAPGFLNKLIQYDIENWLPNNTLSKIDSLGMANSIESRLPFLDHRLVEFTASLPGNYKIRRQTNKYLLRKVAQNILPSGVSSMPKQAFYLPLEKVFGQTFNQFAMDILLSEKFRMRNLFKQDIVRNLLQLTDSGELVDSKQIMSLLFLELWFRSFVDQE